MAIKYLLYNPTTATYVDFSTYGVRVESSKGLTDLAKRKNPMSVNWSDKDGESLDLARATYQPREITLKCWMPAEGMVDFLHKCANFEALWMTQGSGGGVHHLQVVLNEARRDGTLNYFCYTKDGIAYDKRWSNSQMVGVFTLKLIEPEPNKQVIIPHYPSAEYSAFWYNNKMKLKVRFFAERLVKIFFRGSTATATITVGGQSVTLSNPSDGWTYNIIGETEIDLIQANTDTADNQLFIIANPADITWTGTTAASKKRGVFRYNQDTLVDTNDSDNLLTLTPSPIVWNF